MITLTPYNPDWANQFLQEREQLITLLPDHIAEIEHIGSTAIGNIKAKPVVDILIGVNNLTEFGQEQIETIVQLGYHHRKDFEAALPFRRFFEKNNSAGIRTHHIHLVNQYSAWWYRHLRFRDFMQKYPEQAKQYEKLKLDLASQYDDTLEYAFAKSEFVEGINQDAFFDWTTHRPFTNTPRLWGAIVQPACLDVITTMHHNPAFIENYGIKFTQEHLKRVLEKDIAHWDQYQFGPLVWFDNRNQQFIGKGGCRYITLENRKECELAYALMPDYWGQGMAYEISQYALANAFEQQQIDSVICFTRTENKRSLRVMEKSGFEYERTFNHCNMEHQLYRLTQRRYFDTR